MAGYTRNDTSNNIATGNVINAADLDGEFDALVAAFHASTGHTHDGTAANGAPITKIGPVQDLVISTGAITPKTDNTVDLGSSSFEFKDLYIDGTANIDALVADTADINAGTIDGVVIGGSTTAAGSFTTLTTSSTVTLNGGTANGVLYLNGSKVATSGSALVFDGTNLAIGAGAPTNLLTLLATSTPGIDFLNGAGTKRAVISASSSALNFNSLTTNPIIWQIDSSEQMRLTSTGLGIGTSLPGARLELYTAGTVNLRLNGSLVGGNTVDFYNYIPAAANNGFAIALGGTVRAAIDSSGNLGLGVTPSAWGSGWKALELPNGVAISTAFGVDYQTVNAYHDGTNFIYKDSSVASLYQNGPGLHAWYTAPSGTAGNAITFTQAMTLDASGRLGVGSTGPTAQLVVQGSGGGGWIAGARNVVQLYNPNTSATNVSNGIIFGDASNSARWAIYNDLLANGSEADVLSFVNLGTERARITSGGILYVNSTDNGLTSALKLSVTGATGEGAFLFKNDAGASQWTGWVWNTATSGDNLFISFLTEGGTGTGRGSITYNRTGGLVAYNTTSDYRAKDILGSVTDSGAIIDALKVYEGKMKGATQSRPMLVAHEAQEVAPYAVTGEKDAVDEDGNPKYQQMDVSSFVPLLIAEIQSLRQRVAQLEGTQP